MASKFDDDSVYFLRLTEHTVFPDINDKYSEYIYLYIFLTSE